MKDAKQDQRVSRLYTILFSDLVGSTDLQEKMGSVRAAELIDLHRGIFRRILKETGGIEVETAGDSFLALFETPSAGVGFALKLQAETHGAQREEPDLPGVRIGLHLGEVLVKYRDSGYRPSEVSGRQVSAASRIADLGLGGQVLCSREIFDNARTILHEGETDGTGAVIWLSHGAYRFKGLEDPIDIYEIGREGLAPLSAPQSGAKAWPVEADEVSGWRPAAGTVVPETNWVLDERLGRETRPFGQADGYRGVFGEVWKAWNPKLHSWRVFKFCFKREFVPVLKREARLLERLRQYHHPNLVEVHDVTVGERPPYYLQMEFVDGPSIEAWLETDPPLEERLEIVAQAADALDLAHSVGIYHRDIKPSNILLAESSSGELTAKLTDFGLGAAEDKKILESIYLSRVDGVAGTWDYIAPELREGAPATPQSDIYSLGLTLYQVVSGDLNRPFGDWERFVESEVLVEDIRMCIAAEPKDRWLQARDLAEALRDHDHRLEVFRSARKRKLSEFRRRSEGQRLVLFLVALLALASIGFGGYAWHQKGLAEKHHRLAQAQRDEAERQKGLAEKQKQIALEAIRRLTYDLPVMLENIPGALEVSKNVFENNIDLLDRLLALDSDAPLVMAQKAANLKQTAQVWFVLQNMEKAEQAYREAAGIFDRLAADSPDDPKWHIEAAACRIKSGDILYEQNDLDKALAAYQAARTDLDIMVALSPDDIVKRFERAELGHKIGRILTRQGRPGKAVEAYASALEALREAEALNPDGWESRWTLALGYADLGRALMDLGDGPKAIQALRAGIAAAEKQSFPDRKDQWDRLLARMQLTLSLTLAKSSDSEETLQSLWKAVKAVNALPEGIREDLPVQADLAEVHSRIGRLMARQGLLESAETELRTAMDIQKRVTEQEPDNPQATRRLSLIAYRLGVIRTDRSEFQAALDSLQTARKLQEQLANGDPGNPIFKSDLAETCRQLGQACFGREDRDGALRFYLQSRDIWQGLVGRDPDNLEWQMKRALVHGRIADTLVYKRDYKGVLEALEAEAAILKYIGGRNRDYPHLKEETALVGAKMERVRTLMKIKNQAAPSGD